MIWWLWWSEISTIQKYGNFVHDKLPLCFTTMKFSKAALFFCVYVLLDNSEFDEFPGFLYNKFQVL